MNKGTMNAKGVFFSLQSEKGHKFYKRTFVSEQGSKITERGITWLGAVKTHRDMFGNLRKISLTANFGFTWIIGFFTMLWFFIGIFFIVLWDGVKWGGRKIRQFCHRIKAGRFRPDFDKSKKQKKNHQGIWWTLMIILLAVLFCWWYRNGATTENVEPVATIEYYNESDAEINGELYGACVYDACRLKGYLDGFQTEAKPIGNGRYLLMLGVTEQDGKWIEKDAKIAKSDIYPQMEKYLLAKKSIFISSIRKRLTSQQMIALQLVHLRMGTTGFSGRLSDGKPSKTRNESELVKALNNEDIVARLFRLPGTNAENLDNSESLKYFWVLYQIYCGNLTVDEVYSFPMQSYLNIPLSEMYENDCPVWNDSLAKHLANGKTQSFNASGVMPDKVPN